MFRTTSRRRRTAVTLLAAAIAAGALAAAAVAATSFTLKVAKHATITDMKSGKTIHGTAVANHNGLLVYILTGDSRKHPKCTSAPCLAAWPPVTVKSAKKLSKAPGIKGKLGTWKHKGFIQVLLNGHPLYLFVGDSKPGVGTGEGINAFGGIWHVWLASAKAASTTSSGSGGGW